MERSGVSGVGLTPPPTGGAPPTGQHASHVDKAQDAAKHGIDKFTGESGDGAR